MGRCSRLAEKKGSSLVLIRRERAPLQHCNHISFFAKKSLVRVVTNRRASKERRLSPKAAIRIVTGQVWTAMQAACDRRQRKYIAVSYLGDGAVELLNLAEGDCLVTDLSDATVKAGATNPREALRALVDYGVDLYSVENLHAKAIVCESTVIIGSANASRHSERDLLEACAVITEPKTAKRVEKWIRALCGERVGKDSLKRKIKLMPKRRGARGNKRVKTKRADNVPTHAPLWLVSTRPVDEFFAEHSASVEERTSRLRNHRARRGYDVTSWQWTGGGRFATSVKAGDQIIEVKGDPNPMRVCEPQTVLKVEKRHHNGRVVRYIYLEYATDERSFTYQTFVKRATRVGVRVAKRPRKLIRNTTKAHQLRQIFLDK